MKPIAWSPIPASANFQPPRRASLSRDLIKVSSASSKTASTVAPLLYRASPIDPALHSPASPDSLSRDLANYTTSTPQPSDGPQTPQLPSATEFGNSLGNPDSTPPSSTTLPSLESLHENLGLPRSTTPLPRLSALASVAVAPTSNIRYVSCLISGDGGLDRNACDCYCLQRSRFLSLSSVYEIVCACPFFPPACLAFTRLFDA